MLGGLIEVRLHIFMAIRWTNFYPASAKFARPNIQGADILRKLYPKHSLVMSQDYNLNLLGFPHAMAIPLNPDELITNAFFVQLGRGGGGVLINNVEFGAFKLAWEVRVDSLM